MFSLIITIISIALVAVLALATLYYGGDAFNQGSTKAQTARIQNQAAQLTAAAELFAVEFGRQPNSINELLATRYLKSDPTAQAAVSQALADNSWRMVVEGDRTAQGTGTREGIPVFVLSMGESETCLSVNDSSYGEPGILRAVHRDLALQCYGTTLDQLWVMASKRPRHIEEAAAAEASLAASAFWAPGITFAGALTGTVPSATDQSVWLQAPHLRAPVSGGDASPPTEGPTQPVPSAALSLYAATTTDFGTRYVGSLTSLTFTVVNEGDGAATGVFASTSGSNALTISAANNSCGTAAAPVTLAAGQACSFAAELQSSSVLTLENAYVGLQSADTAAPQPVAVTGVVVLPPPTYSVAVSNTQFVAIPTTQYSRAITLTNTSTGNQTIDMPSLSLEGAASSLFSVSGCTEAALAPNASCSLTVSFNPGPTVVDGAAVNLVWTDAKAGSQTLALTANSTYTPATLTTPSGQASPNGLPALSGTTATWGSTAGWGGFSVGSAFRTEGRFAVAFSGPTSSLNKLQFNVQSSAGGFYGTDFTTGKIVKGGGMAGGSANETVFTKPSLQTDSRILMLVDMGARSVAWYACAATTCSATPFHTATGLSSPLRAYVWKPGSGAAQVAATTSNIQGMPAAGATYLAGMPH